MGAIFESQNALHFCQIQLGSDTLRVEESPDTQETAGSAGQPTLGENRSAHQAYQKHLSEEMLLEPPRSRAKWVLLLLPATWWNLPTFARNNREVW